MTEPGSIRKAASGLLLFLLIALFSTPASTGDPDKVFLTIRTKHFDIHYEEELEHTARVTAALAEEIHEELTILFGWQVRKTIQVVITDSTDSSNGSAAVRGEPVIRLYAVAPSLESSLQTHDHWLRTLFTHEYTHIVHLSIRGKIPDIVNRVFGDIYLPNQMLPEWLIEGIAVLNETHRTSGGRIRSSLYQMYIRTSALEGTLLSLGQVSNYSREYLRGSHSYIYGAMFMEYVYQKHGMEKIVEFCHEYGKSVIPYGINRLFKKIFGQGVKELYDEWIAHEKKEAEKIRRALKKDGITKSSALTDDGESKGPPIFEIDDKSILLPVSNGIDKTAVYRLFLNGKKKKGLVYSNTSSHVSQDRTGRLFYTRTAPYKNYYYFQDLFVLEGEDASPRRLTVGRRSRYAAISPTGDRVAMTVTDAGTSKLILADEQGQELRTLIDSAPDDQVYEPSWSPDGKHIVAVVRKGAYVDLVLIDVETKHIEPLTHNRFIESRPTFTRDGRYIVFASDASGISNIYALDLRGKKLLQITNMLTGAFSPAVSNDGKTVAFLKYSSKGYDLHTAAFSPATAPLAKDAADRFDAPRPLPAVKQIRGRPYNPFSTMFPSYWTLNTSLNADWDITLEASTAFSDVTGKHYLSGTVLYETEEQTVSGRLGYSYYGIGPTVHLGLARQYLKQDTGYTYGGENKQWLQVVTRGSLSLSFPVRNVDSGHSLNVGYNIVHTRPKDKKATDLDPSEEQPEVPSQYFRAGLSLRWSYSNTVSSSLSIGAHKGRSLSTGLTFYHPMIGGEKTAAAFSYRWTEFLPVPIRRLLPYHVLVLSLSGAAYISDPPNQSSYALGGQSEINIVDTIVNNESNGTASLRGYSPGAFRGSHYHLLRANYRFPIWFTEAAYSTVPLFLRRIQASIFSDNAVISYGEINRDDWHSSIGAELAWIFSMGYYQEMSLRTGYAYGLMDGGIHEFIFVLSGGL